MTSRSILALAVAVLAVTACVATVRANDMEEFEVDASAPEAVVGGGVPATDDDVPVPEDHDVEYTPDASAFFFAETFQGDNSNVVKSRTEKYAGQPIKVDVPDLFSGIAGDKGLIATAAARHYGVSFPFAKDLVLGDDDTFVLQYEVRMQQGLQCGGAYLKVPAASSGLDLGALEPDTPYIVMFGPDKCGTTNKVHFILRHENPVNGEWSEHHLTAPPLPKDDKFSHVYTLVIRPDNTFDILIDQESAFSGNLLEDMTPPINPPEEIPDPEDEKPDTWVDDAKIPDPEAVKPEDWDEDAPATIDDVNAVKPAGWLDDAEEYVADPEAEQPEDWDEEEDGEWEAPLVPNPECEEAPGCGEWVRPVIPNPEYKGKWSAPMIDNPEYIGEWAPRNIPNPAYFVDEHPHKLPAMAGVAVEIWTMTAGLFFDNVVVGNSEEDAAAFAAATWSPRYTAQVDRDEQVRARIARQQREEAFRTGGMMAKVNYYLMELMDLAAQNPIPTVVSIAVMFASMLLCCLLGGSSTPRRPRTAYRAPRNQDTNTGENEATADNDGNGDDGDDDEEEEEDTPEAAGDEGDEGDDSGSDDDDEGSDDSEEDSDEEDDDDGSNGAETASQGTPTLRRRSRRRMKRSDD